MDNNGESIRWVQNVYERNRRYRQAFMGAVFKMSEKSALDKKTHELAYISVLVSTKMYGGLPFHINQAKENGASVDEIRSAIHVPLPIMGIQVTDELPYLNELIEK